ncbi:hypothetical protein OAN61_00625 [bacterium]|nr:hypothetical protein [bacterium]
MDDAANDTVLFPQRPPPPTHKKKRVAMKAADGSLQADDPKYTQHFDRPDESRKADTKVLSKTVRPSLASVVSESETGADGNTAALQASSSSSKSTTTKKWLSQPVLATAASTSRKLRDIGRRDTSGDDAGSRSPARNEAIQLLTEVADIKLSNDSPNTFCHRPGSDSRSRPR